MPGLRTAAALLTSLALGAAAQGPLKGDELFSYRGPDREARLAGQAKKEGSLVLYTSLAPTESKPLAEAFTKKYGVKVDLWRALSSNVLQRVVTEGRAHRNSVDVVETNGPEMESIAREKLFARVASPYVGDLPPKAVQAHQLWLPDRFDFFVVGYNTQKVQRSEIPATYEGFLDPRWKGRIGIEATDEEWMAALVKHWGEAKGMDFFRKLATLQPSLRKGHILLAKLVAAGEVPVGLTLYNGNVLSARRKGAPIDYVPVQPVVARAQGIGVAKAAPHAAAAALFEDFVLSPEGQQLLDSMGRAPASTRVKSNLNNFDYILVDPAAVLDESDKWEKIWNGLFLAR